MLSPHARQIDNQFRERQEVDVKLENCCIQLWVQPERMPCEAIDYRYQLAKSFDTPIYGRNLILSPKDVSGCQLY